MAGASLAGVIAFGRKIYVVRRIRAAGQPAKISWCLRLLGVEQWQSRDMRDTFA